MYAETLKTNSCGKTNSPVIDSLFSFNLPRLFEKVKLKRTWMKGELDSKILVNGPDKQVVLTTIYEDTKIIFFQCNDSFTFYVIDGKLKLNISASPHLVNNIFGYILQFGLTNLVA